MIGVVWMSCISGSQMTLLGELLGFTNKDFGYLTAIAWSAYIGQLISAVIIERTGQRKYQFIVYAAAHRLIWLVIAAVPLLMGPSRSAIRAFMILYAVGAVLAHMSMPPWQNWMGDMIPRRLRGRYFATRRVWTTPVQIAVTVAAGLALDWATVKMPEGTPITTATQPYLMWIIAGLFAFGAIFGTIDVLLFLRLREIASPALAGASDSPKRRPLAAILTGLGEAVEAIVQAVLDRGFLFYALFGATMGFAMTVAAPFFWRNSLSNLHYPKFWANVVFMVCSPLSALLTVRLWGRLIDRWGRRPVLILSAAGTILSPVPWLLIPPGGHGNLPLAIAFGAAACLIGGVMWSGVELGRFNVLLGFSESAGRSKYMAAAAVFSAVGGLTGGITGGWLADYFVAFQHDASPLHVGPFLWNNWHFTFLVSMAARAASLIWLIPMPDPGAKRFRDVIRHIRVNVYNNALPRLFSRPGLWRRLRQARPDGKPPRMRWLGALLPRRRPRRRHKAA